ncbi:hypothetical protein SBADM41S_05767 [Streptomyces badius]
MASSSRTGAAKAGRVLHGGQGDLPAAAPQSARGDLDRAAADSGRRRWGRASRWGRFRQIAEFLRRFPDPGVGARGPVPRPPSPAGRGPPPSSPRRNPWGPPLACRLRQRAQGERVVRRMGVEGGAQGDDADHLAGLISADGSAGSKSASLAYSWKYGGLVFCAWSPTRWATASLATSVTCAAGAGAGPGSPVQHPHGQDGGVCGGAVRLRGHGPHATGACHQPRSAIGGASWSRRLRPPPRGTPTGPMPAHHQRQAP